MQIFHVPGFPASRWSLSRMGHFNSWLKWRNESGFVIPVSGILQPVATWSCWIVDSLNWGFRPQLPVCWRLIANTFCYQLPMNQPLPRNSRAICSGTAGSVWSISTRQSICYRHRPAKQEAGGYVTRSTWSTLAPVQPGRHSNWGWPAAFGFTTCVLKWTIIFAKDCHTLKYWNWSYRKPQQA